ncbi:MAG: FAD-dependent oxidoreductase, partial [Solirubrobacterales bacterium]|nr:FAD-dependent oxidoreductase [Solirubrobacterales bacterium]
AIGADVRTSLGEAAITQASLQQLARLFGPEALQPRATIVKDWAADSLTASASDRIAGGHPAPVSKAWVDGVWRERLFLGGSETSDSEAGYLAGAVSAAQRAARKAVESVRGWRDRPAR